ncbi:hypothetical protein [Burkholderia vietnamiensis]|uniref:hypothetical protein n=1 Tax=Burkholderia vietnamiensis TaxID=60552 RepID=UPI001CC77976|nr:hypothetical protein [Burkholderia vietnamiensis]
MLLRIFRARAGKYAGRRTPDQIGHHAKRLRIRTAVIAEWKIVRRRSAIRMLEIPCYKTK